MKLFKRLLITLLIALVVPVLKVNATNNLTIDEKSYDENTLEFRVSGSSNYSEVMVSLFDGDNLLSLKTVPSNNNSYNAEFSIAFDEDKLITVKVGDINSSNYKISVLNVKKSVVPTKSNKITDDAGNSLTILDSLKKFELNDNLEVQVIEDLESLDDDDKEKVAALQTKLGIKKKLVGIMMIMVTNGEDNVELDEIEKGYEFFLSVPKEKLEPYKKPYAARLLSEDTLEFESGLKMNYDSTKNGVTLAINNIGIYLLYDDISKDYGFLDNTGNQTYNLKKDDMLTLRIDADFSKFLGIYIDGKPVDSKNYTKKSGSTIITLSKEYMQSLSVGEHSIKVDFTDGEANTTVTIIESVLNPKTYDFIGKSVLTLIISSIVIGSLLIYMKKKQTN